MILSTHPASRIHVRQDYEWIDRRRPTIIDAVRGKIDVHSTIFYWFAIVQCFQSLNEVLDSVNPHRRQAERADREVVEISSK